MFGDLVCHYLFVDLTDESAWLLSCLGAESLDSYKGSKYSFWVRNMMNAFEGCAAAFLPEIRRGHALSNMYDSSIFGSGRVLDDLIEEFLFRHFLFRTGYLPVTIPEERFESGHLPAGILSFGE